MKKSNLTVCLRIVLALAGGSLLPAQTIFVSHFNAGRVVQITPGGSISTFVTVGANSVLPTGIAFDSGGNLYVAINTTGAILKVTPAGSSSTFATGLSHPQGLAFDTLGNLYVANNDLGTISKITSAGNVSTFATGVPSANGLAFNSSGDLFVASQAGSPAIYRVNPAGDVSTFTTAVSSPTGLAFDPDDNLFVSEYSSGSVKKFLAGGGSSDFVTGLNTTYGLSYTNDLLYVITLNGSALKVYDSSAVLQATHTFGTNSSGGPSQPIYVAIAIPEPSAFAALAGLIVMGIAAGRRRLAALVGGKRQRSGEPERS